MNAVFTIGVYGATETSFFGALGEAGITDFCDIRARRGMRGARYPFVNKTRLIERLERSGIRYHHVKDLAPTKDMRAAQRREDAETGEAKRSRTALGPTFIAEFEANVLADFDPNAFAQRFPANARVCLFCVEAEPAACHRSLVAQYLSDALQIEAVHLSSS